MLRLGKLNCLLLKFKYAIKGTEMESNVTKFADFIGKSTDISIPNAAFHSAKLIVADCLGAIIGGMAEPEIRALSESEGANSKNFFKILDDTKKVNDETKRLLEIQKDSMIKFLMKIPKLYYTKSHFPLEISQRAFDHLWRVCESFEMWCKETKQEKLIELNILE